VNRKEEIYFATRCPCKYCSGTRLSDKLVNWILGFEKYLGKKLTLTSGARCEIYNREIGGQDVKIIIGVSEVIISPHIYRIIII